jgi:carbon monoxide dehydrogenase subunit G
MKLEHEFRVPVPISQAWDVLLDVERIAPCMPGATVESFDGETVNGRVKVKVGPIQVTYSGTARFIEKNEPGRRVTLDASGKEARGSGTAKATIVAVLQDDGDSATKVSVTTDLAITGKPAQFGRGVMVEVGNKLLGRFADCLAEQIGMGSSGDAESSGTADGPEAEAPAAAASTGDDRTAAAAAAPASAGGNGDVGGAEASGAGGNGASAAPGAEALADAAGGDAVAITPDGDSGSGDGEGVGAVGPGTGAAGTAAASGTGARTATSGASPNGGQTGSPQIRTLPSATASRFPHRPAENEAIDLLDVGGAAILKRVAPLAIGLVVLVVLWRLLHRR